MSVRLAWLAGLLVVAAALTTVCLPIAAKAQTQSEAHACCPDAVRFCGTTADVCRRPVLTATVGEMIVCGTKLFWHRAQLSPACSAVFAAHGK